MADRVQKGRDAWVRGHWAEMLAALSLFLKGYRLLARRYRGPSGEIDLIALKGGHLIFIEVKARPDLAQGLDAIRPHNVERIRRTAAHFAATRSALRDLPWRFDVIAVAPRAWPRHVRDAFRG